MAGGPRAMHRMRDGSASGNFARGTGAADGRACFPKDAERSNHPSSLTGPLRSAVRERRPGNRRRRRIGGATAPVVGRREPRARLELHWSERAGRAASDEGQVRRPFADARRQNEGPAESFVTNEERAKPGHAQRAIVPASEGADGVQARDRRRRIDGAEQQVLTRRRGVGLHDDVEPNIVRVGVARQREDHRRRRIDVGRRARRRRRWLTRQERKTNQECP